MDKMTPTMMRHYNQNKVFQLIYEEKRISRQQIAKKLNLSLPTVTQNLQFLEEARLIKRSGFFQSTGGRKSIVYSCVSDSRIAIGTQITRHYFRIIAIDLYGGVLKRQQIDLVYEHSEDYYRALGESINTFIKSLNISAKHVLGVGIAVMALLSKDRQSITRSVLLGQTSADLTDFARWIDYPCQMLHDIEAAANAELWFSPEITDAVYLGLNYHLSGMLIMNGKVHTGKEYTGGLVEHLTLFPNGRPCYCGKQGCFTEYCSGKVLFDTYGKNPDDFFRLLRDGDRTACELWKEYLEHLAIAIGSLYAVLDCDIILSGTVGNHMTEEDVHILQRSVRNQFLYAPVSNFIYLGHKDADICSCGAAALYVADFLGNL